MRLTRSALLAITACSTGAFCDFLEPTYPAPLDLSSSSSLVPKSWKNLTSTIKGFIDDGKSDLTSQSGWKNLTFSIGMFSTNDPSAAKSLQFHHTSAEVANSSVGLNEVDGNSIYRLASMTKLFTVFAGMLELADSDWDRPITEFVPSLAAYSAAHPAEADLVRTVEWNKVTLGALASQIGGTPRDVEPFDPSEWLFTVPAKVLGSFGLPPLNASDAVAFTPCVVALYANETCSFDLYASGAQARPPLFRPWTSPAYTDFGFMLLGIAIANITNKSIHDVYSESIFGPLGMTSSHSTVPDESQRGQYVIAGTLLSASFVDLPTIFDVSIPSGGMFSTTNDVAKMGTAILNSTLLDSDQTRKWMKPVSHTAMFEYSLGKPWEIYRYTHPRTGLVTDIYTKSGDSGNYGSFIVLIPDFGAGFSLIGASSLTERSAQTALLMDLITEQMLPALTSQAEAEAKRNLAGKYVSEDKSLNSTLTLAIDPKGQPGLVITQFISNGTDVLNSGAIGRSPVRLLHSISDLSSGQIAFRTSSLHPPKGGLFTRQYNVNLDWLAGDSPAYGGVGVGLFIFDVGPKGKATAVSPAAWRVKLAKAS